MADNCLNKLKEKYGDKFSDRELKAIDDYIKDIGSQYNGRLSQYQSLLKTAITEAEVNHLRRIKSEINGLARLHKNIQYVTRFKNPAEGLLALWEGTSNAAVGSAMSVNNLHSTYKAGNVSQFNSMIRSKGFFPMLIDEQGQRSIWREYLNRARDPNYKSQASSAVNEAVESIIKLNRFLIGNEQSAGSTIQFNAERLVSNFHNPDTILKDVDTWVEDAMNYIDKERSFGPTVSTDDQLRYALQDFAKDLGDVMKGDVSLSNIIGGKREIFFKDGDSAFEYNSKYGHENLYTGLVKSIDNSAKITAAVRVFGDNPIKGYEKAREFVKETMSSMKSAELGKADDAMNYFRGMGNRFQDPTSGLARSYEVIQTAKIYNHARVLGNVAWAVLEDLPMTLLQVQASSGGNIFANTAGIIGDFISSVPKVLKKDMADFTMVLLEDIEREFLKEAGGTSIGVLSKAADAYATMNLSKPLTKVTRNTAARAHQRVLVNNIKSLKPSTEQMTVRGIMGIDDRDVENLRRVLGDSRSIDFRAILESDIGDEAYKMKLVEALGSYVNMAVDRSVPAVGAKQARILQRHKPKDSWERQAVALVSDLKSSLLTVSHSWDAALKMGDPVNNNRFSTNSVKNVGSVVLAVIAFNYAKQYAREVWEGKESDPRLTEGEVATRRMIEAIARSSVGGLVVDTALAPLMRVLKELATGEKPRPSDAISLVPTASFALELMDASIKEGIYSMDLDVDPKLQAKIMKRVMLNSNYDSVPDFLERNSKLLPFQNHLLIQAVKGHILKEADMAGRRY